MFDDANNTTTPWLASLLDYLSLLQNQLGERISPIVENTKPIWTDPLWQFIGLIIVGAITLTILFVLLRFIGNALLALLIGLKERITGLFKGVWKRLKKDNTADVEEETPENEPQRAERSFWFSSMSVKKAFDSVRYLTTRRDWRYESSWYLMSGTQGSDKDKWLNDLQQHRRAHLLFREKQLISPDSGWHFFDSGLIIDVDEQANFDKAVELLSSYRPERPLDGLILAVSAKQLNEHRDEPAALKKLGQDLYEKMWSVQKITGFSLPVYLVVTESESVKGFHTFWSSWSEEPVNEIFGWSNPSKIDTAFSLQWVKDAFASTLACIRKAQLNVAANSEKISDIDSFILFDREFHTLEEPLTQVISEAFSRSSFQEALPLRGIWFTGQIDGRYELSEELLHEKIWPETNLAYPIEKRFFSANRTLRRFQYASMIGAAILLLALGIDSYRMQNYTRSAEQAWTNIFTREEKRFYCSNEGIDTWWLLNSITKLADQPVTPSIPLSWGGGQLPEIKEASANHIYPKILFPAYECRLRHRAAALNALSQASIDEHAPLDKLEDQLNEYIQALGEYQQAQTWFIELVGPLNRPDNVAKKIRKLTDYLYDGAIPSTIDFNTDLLVQSVMEAHYDIEWEANELVDASEQTTYLTRLSRVVRSSIENQASSPPLNDITAAFFIRPEMKITTHKPNEIFDNKQMLASVDKFQHWLHYMSNHWLNYSLDSSPCYQPYKSLQALEQLLDKSGYPKKPIAHSVNLFSPDNCDNHIIAQLEKLNKPPFGQVFVKDSLNNLAFSNELLHWVNEFSALERLNLLAINNSPDLSHELEATGKVVAWNLAPLSEAIDIMLGFQAFNQQWWARADGRREEPFYAPALRARLHQVVEQHIARARVFEYTKKPSNINGFKDKESELANSVESFKRVESSLRQLRLLLKQEGDGANVDRLQKFSRAFILDRLSLLSNIVTENKFYTPIKRTDWDSNNLAAALFNYNDPKSMGVYLENQRERLNFLAQNYAKPLVAYLLDTDQVDESRNDARLWYNTLVELQQYARSQSENAVLQLENYLSKDLIDQSWQSCEAITQTPSVFNSGGLFSQRHYDISEDIRFKCGIYSKNSVMRQYLALAERFNRDLKGQFPFARYQARQRKDIDPGVLKRFIEDYQSQWAKPKTGKPLAQALADYFSANSNTGLESWLVFVARLDRFVDFYESVSDKEGHISVPLDIEFNAKASSSQGQDQIIEWRMSSGQELAIFPNGKSQLTWNYGDPLSVTLRWATGSQYYPLNQYKPANSHDKPAVINPQTYSARFQTDSPWGLFELLQRFGQPKRSNSRQNWYLFSVPVATKPSPKKDAEQLETPAYISRIHLASSALTEKDNGQQQALAIPFDIPRSAPTIPGQ